MRHSATKPRLILGLMLCGLLALACCIGETDPAAAYRMGGFGRGGHFGRPAAGMRRGPWRQMLLHRGRGRVFVDRPSGWSGRNTAPAADGLGPRHHRIIGGGDIGRNVPATDDGGSRHHRIIGGGGDIGRIPGGAGRVDIGGGNPGGGSGDGSSSGGGGGGSGGRGAPPRAAQRFVPDEVITEFSPRATPEVIDRIARRLDLTPLESQNFPLIGSTFYRWRIGGGRSVAQIVNALAAERIVASVQPNYIFTLQEDAARIAAAPPGDAAQYVLGKLQIEQAHRLATGKGVLVAVIDSEIDAGHPDLAGAVVKSFDALGGATDPHRHGTAMAGAIAAHGKLLGIAPGAKLLAARAFDDTPGVALGSSFAIYKSLQWAADNAARIVNMSFAGPADPTLHRMLAAAYENGMVLVAAAGNTGPDSPPLYPAADPDVIAVTATDSNDDLFKLASRGRYIPVAAPGVEILALAPAASYQIATGTSVAAAHVSGIAALLLERKPSLKPPFVRTVIMTTARPRAAAGRDSETVAGLVNAYRAVMLLGGRSPPQDDDAQAKQ